MQPERIVVFDLDGTLVRCNSFHRWLAYLIFCPSSRVTIGLRLLIALLCLARGLRLITHFELKRQVMLRATIPDEAVEIFIKSYLLPSLSSRCMGELERWQAQGYKTILVTAAPEHYAAVFGARLGFRETIGSGFWRDGIFFENIRQAKLDRMLSIIGEQRLHVVYSDHPDDLPLLEKAEYRYIVNPKRKHLKKIERKLGAGEFFLLEDPPG